MGGSIGYWQRDPLVLVDDIMALRPSIFIGVPRVYDRIYQRVMVGGYVPHLPAGHGGAIHLVMPVLPS